MADKDYKIDRIDADKEGLTEDVKAQVPDFYSETVFDFSDEEKHPIYDDLDSSAYIPPYEDEAPSYDDRPYEDTPSYSKEHKEKEVESESIEDEKDKHESDKVEPEKKSNDNEEVPNNKQEIPENPNNKEENKPELANKPDLGNNEDSPLKDLGDKAKDGKGDLPTGDMSKMPDLGNMGNMNNPLGNLPFGKDDKKQEPPEEEQEEKSEEDKSLLERKIDRNKRNTKNNADNLRNAADVAIATHDPTATAIGTTVKKADELTGGLSTELMGQALTNNFKFSPGGKQIQKSLNYINESGMGDKLGQAAAMMGAANGGGSGGVPSGGQKPSKPPTPEKTPAPKPDAKKGSPQPKKEESPSKKSSSNNDSKKETPKVNKNPLLDDDFGDFLQFLIDHPYIVITILVLILSFFLIMFEDELAPKGSGNKSCVYDLNGVTTTDSIKTKNMKVELINCDGTASNYTVLETIDFEKYALGVALAEAGEDATEEELKAQIIIARNMALTRNKELCPSNPDNCFYGYNKTNDYIRLRACELDKIYWDYEKDGYTENKDEKSLYSPEVKEGSVWKKALDRTKKTEVLSIASTVKGLVLLDNNGNVVQVSNKPLILTEEDKEKSYTEILESKFGSNNYNTNKKCT